MTLNLWRAPEAGPCERALIAAHYRPWTVYVGSSCVKCGPVSFYWYLSRHARVGAIGWTYIAGPGHELQCRW